ncbi:MAG: 1-phosphofructokinase family hexose kinase [Brevundimonas sp.]
MTERIVTVTLNPAIDLTVRLDGLHPGETHRARGAVSNAGGKGVNVASCLADWGAPVTVGGLLGKDNAASFEALFADKGIEDAMTRLPGATRINVKLAERDGRTTDVNLPGLSTSQDDLDGLRAVLDRVAPSLLVLSGSLPEGLPARTWADLSAEWRARGARVVMDISEAPLAVALAGPGSRPHVLKPNRDELSILAGAALDAAGLLRQARLIQASGVALVVVSLGAGGALFVGPDEALHAKALHVDALSSVGAGDAMVAGLVAALVEDADLVRTARLATAFAAGKLRVVGPHLPPRDAIERLADQVKIKSADDWVGAREDAA